MNVKLTPSIKVATLDDAQHISSMLQDADPNYVQYFTPFSYDYSTIKGKIKESILDTYFVIVNNSESEGSPDFLGFFMLRGMDQGYESPMFGIFIRQCWSNMGLARLALSYAEVYCRINLYPSLLLKVNQKNKKAIKLYLSHGFICSNNNISGDNMLMLKSTGCI
jgi:hypothetical protein